MVIRGRLSYNAFGKFEVYKDKPKEYRSIIRYYNLPDWQETTIQGHGWIENYVINENFYLLPKSN